MFSLKNLPLLRCKDDLASLPEGKLLINTVNAYSFNRARRDPLFAEALLGGDVLLPDGIGIVKACRWCRTDRRPRERVTGWDLFEFEMSRLNRRGGRCFFMGSSERVLELVRERARRLYPRIEVITYSPPYKPELDEADSRPIVEAINAADPDLLWIGMTAPKQEKWIYTHWDELDIRCHCGSVGAVFDFFAGTVPRAPRWWQAHSLEWLYRLYREPRRMWKRYLVGNVEFLYNILVKE